MTSTFKDHRPTVPYCQEVKAGQAVYTKFTLALYDFFVLGLSNHWIWKCPTPHLLKYDNRHVSGNHLGIGVGTGYFLDHCQFPTKTPRLGLLDLNPTCLEMALKRLARFQPTIFRANALEPIHIGAPRVRLLRPELSTALSARDHSHKSHRPGTGEKGPQPRWGGLRIDLASGRSGTQLDGPPTDEGLQREKILL